MLDDREFQRELVRSMLTLPTASLFDGRLGDHNRKGGGKLSIDFMVGRFVSKVCGCVDSSVQDDRNYRDNPPAKEGQQQEHSGDGAPGYGQGGYGG
tara:strand:- start:3700 stop:3987 length:288 start_codon:yes stop_codon:yes gene_type:complete